MIEVRGAPLFAEEEPVAAGGAGGFTFLEITAVRREPGADADHNNRSARIVRKPEMFRGMNESRNAGAFLEPFGEEAGANAFPGAAMTSKADVRDQEVGLFGVALQTGSDGIKARLKFRKAAGKLRGGELVPQLGVFAHEIDNVASPEIGIEFRALVRVAVFQEKARGGDALRDELDKLPGGRGDGAFPQKSGTQRNALARCAGDFFFAGEPKQVDNFVHQFRRVRRENA